MATSRKQSGFLIQSTHGNQGNFELVVPADGGGLAHYWRENDDPQLPWHGAFRFGSGNVSAVSLIQGNFGPGNLEVVAREDNQLVFYWRLGEPPWTWNGPFVIGSGVAGTPALIQSSHGAKGNFELIVPITSGGLAHYWRDNDDPALPWHGPFPFGGGNVSAVSLIQSNFGPGNLEVVAREGNQLVFYWRLGEPPWNWNGPFVIGTGVAGTPSLIQSTHGTMGNFELVVPLAGGGLAHYWRDNDDPNFPWHGPFSFGSGTVSSLSLIQSNFGAGNLEVIAREGNRWVHYWRLGEPPWTWNGPFPIGDECVHLHVKILTTPTISIADMIASMREVYATAGIRLEVLSTENLNLPDLNDLDIGECVRGETTAEQDQLFGNRNNVGTNEVVVYFLRSTVPPTNGCAAHPDSRPGAVVTRGATRWTLGHEIGHVLGLNHVNDNDRLMTGNGTANITNPPPDLVQSEIQTMRTSNLTLRC